MLCVLCHATRPAHEQATSPQLLHAAPGASCSCQRGASSPAAWRHSVGAQRERQEVPTHPALPFRNCTCSGHVFVNGGKVNASIGALAACLGDAVPADVDLVTLDFSVGSSAGGCRSMRFQARASLVGCSLTHPAALSRDGICRGDFAGRPGLTPRSAAACRTTCLRCHAYIVPRAPLRADEADSEQRWRESELLLRGLLRLPSRQGRVSPWHRPRPRLPWSTAWCLRTAQLGA